MTKYRNTIYQELVLEHLTKAGVALSHAEIQKMMDGSINRVTIYRILDRFESKGILHKIIDGEGIAKYALCKDCKSTKSVHNHNHIHFNCTQCFEVSCIENSPLHFELPEKYHVEKINFNVMGICPKCTIKD
jgi:Fur family ferric uptake transcriptional regulator